MRGLEHGTSDAEQKMSSDVKPQADLKPPKEIGNPENEKKEMPHELGMGTDTRNSPKELTVSDEPKEQVLGGSYRDCKKVSDGNTQQVHHIPAKEVSPLSEGDGPSIIMELADHRLTASWGTSNEAKEYRAKQKELIDQGRFREAFEMDKRDIQSKFGDKYDKAIAQAEAYISKLEQGGVIR